MFTKSYEACKSVSFTIKLTDVTDNRKHQKTKVIKKKQPKIKRKFEAVSKKTTSFFGGIIKTKNRIK